MFCTESKCWTAWQPDPIKKIQSEFNLVSTSVRSIHAGNVDVPDFSYYRRSAVQSPSAKSGDSAAERMSYRFIFGDNHP